MLLAALPDEGKGRVVPDQYWISGVENCSTIDSYINEVSTPIWVVTSGSPAPGFRIFYEQCNYISIPLLCRS